MADLTTLQGLRRSPLHDLAAELRDGAVPGERAVRLLEWPFLTMVSIRVEPGSDTARRIEGVLGTGLPAKCGEVTGHVHSVLWLGPDEWLVVAEPDAGDTIVLELETALAGHHRSVLDVSANRIVYELTDGLERLASSCGLDLDPSRWRPGVCAQTLFGQAQVILHQRDERTTRVFVRPSFAGYLVDLLAVR
jgi:sarcosine oxidase subunit gamma